MKTKTGKIAASLCSLLLATNLIGCTNLEMMTGSHVSEYGDNGILNPSVSAPAETQTSSTSSTNDLEIQITTIEEYEKSLKAKGYLKQAINIVLSPWDYPDDVVEHASYRMLAINDLTIKDVEEELNNILVYSQYPTDVPPEVFQKTVGKLYKCLCYSANPFESYRVMSQKVHELSCDLEHTTEYGIYTCDNLKMQAQSIRPMSLEEYLDINFSNNLGYQKIKEALKTNPNHNFEDYIIELERLAIAQQNPTSYSPEMWKLMFGNLDATLGEYESLYETYIELAVFIYNSFYPDEPLTLNEFGNYTRTLTQDTNA